MTSQASAHELVIIKCEFIPETHHPKTAGRWRLFAQGKRGLEYRSCDATYLPTPGPHYFYAYMHATTGKWRLRGKAPAQEW